ncbi:MAG: SufD family Fe-S cluster assembly protein [Puniceicoccales bacterium]|nr:SufD family Fe-S cluster assembly protein [Puniceicoccales bacterium]
MSIFRRENVNFTIEEKSGGEEIIFRFHVLESGRFVGEFRPKGMLKCALCVELLLEAQAEADLKIFYSARKNFTFRCRTLQRHCGDRSRSNVEVKCVCADHSRVDYCGKIEVPESPTGVKVLQKNANLVLSESACVHTEPAMEIRSKDAECFHGAAIGEIEPDILQYFLLRGVKKSLARDLFVAGFLT